MKGIQKRIQKRNKSSSDNYKHLATQQVWVHKLSNIDPVIWSNTLSMQRQKTPHFQSCSSYIKPKTVCTFREQKGNSIYIFVGTESAK